MLGVRFLDVDFMRINFACGLQTVYLIRLFCTVVKEERLHGAHRDRNAGWRHRSGRAAWRRGPRGQPHFVLPPYVYVAPPVGGTFWFQIFIQASSPEIRPQRFLAVRRSWRGNGVACFWATSLKK